MLGAIDSIGKAARDQYERIKTKNGVKPKTRKDEEENYWQLRGKRFKKQMEI